MKTGIFVDAENIRLCGGYGMDYRILLDIARAGGHEILRANTYVVLDEEKAGKDYEYKTKIDNYFRRIREQGFKISITLVKRYRDAETEEIRIKANADIDLTVDALTQSQRLERVILCTGDGDFAPLATALQSQGLRVEVIAFENVSENLIRVADSFYRGFLLPGLLRNNFQRRDEPSGLYQGMIESLGQEGSYGFVYLFDWQENGGIERKSYFFHENNLPRGLRINDLTSKHLLTFSLVDNSQYKPGTKKAIVSEYRILDQDSRATRPQPIASFPDFIPRASREEVESEEVPPIPPS
jgi:uncharacterized LabA/DUF88 family protein